MKKEDIQERRNRVNHLLFETLSSEIGKHRLINYLQSRDYKYVAIYGAGMVGRLLSNVLTDAGFQVEYYVDKFCEEKAVDGIPVLHFRMDYLEDVQALIITPCHEKDFIQYEMEDYYSDSCSFLNLDEMLEVTI